MFRTTIFLLLIIAGNAMSQKSIKTHEGVMIGGIKQWIGTEGKDDSKPVLLFLHGGPGFSSRAYSKKFVKLLKNDFIVAQWDQRGAGITKAWSGDSVDISLDLMFSDTEEVVRYLLKKFKKEKLYLAGFSWGGFLGLHFADVHPEFLHAYISISGLIHGEESERLTLEWLRSRAADSNNSTAEVELSQVEIPFTNWEEIYFQRKWTEHFTSAKPSSRRYPPKLFKEWSETWLPLFNEASAVNYLELVPKVKCPIYFFVSDKDFVANYLVTQAYYERIEAPYKELVWFENSMHEIPSEEPQRFSNELIKTQAR